MATFSNIDGEESATVTFTVAAVSLTRNSSAELQEIIVVGDPDITTNLAKVMPSAPLSTMAGMVVRIASGPSSAADAIIRVNQGIGISTAGDEWLMKCSSLSTGHVTVDTGSIQVSAFAANLALPSVSSLSTGHVTVDTGTIRAQNYTSSGGAVEGSTDSPAQGILGLHVRQVPSSMQQAVTSTAGQTATATIIISSAAGAAPKVYAFSVTSTVITPSTVSFRSSNASVRWPMVIGSGSSGITGVAMAVAPPAYLFAVTASDALVFHTPSSVAEFHVSVSYFL